MNKKISKVLFVKVGSVKTKKLENDEKREELISAIKKSIVPFAYLTKIGFKEDFQADLLHHGGVNKALFMIGTKTYEKLNLEFENRFSYKEDAHFGENLVLENISEDDICVADILKIGEALVQITQPRQPCWKLSASTDIKNMTNYIFQNGLTGFYAKVLKEGKISFNDEVILEKRANPNLKISKLNEVIVNPKQNEALVLEALSCKDLGIAFKTSLQKRYILGNDDNQFTFYHT